jgi:hypothetical protein
LSAFRAAGTRLISTEDRAVVRCCSDFAVDRRQPEADQSGNKGPQDRAAVELGCKCSRDVIESLTIHQLQTPPQLDPARRWPQ